MKERIWFQAVRLDEVLMAQGRKQRWLAGQIGVSEGHLSHVIRGKRSVNEQVGRRIAELVQVPFPLLFRFTDGNDSLSREEEAA